MSRGWPREVNGVWESIVWVQGCSSLGCRTCGARPWQSPLQSVSFPLLFLQSNAANPLFGGVEEGGDPANPLFGGDGEVAAGRHSRVAAGARAHVQPDAKRMPHPACKASVCSPGLPPLALHGCRVPHRGRPGVRRRRRRGRRAPRVLKRHVPRRGHPGFAPGEMTHNLKKCLGTRGAFQRHAPRREHINVCWAVGRG